ncbi:hypothetical protein Vafri_10880 [Volvox africanus]|uniref:tRNA pseudouridine(55) synthase n=1 Tax=Volvox africanus TaxID=51714 RepID=A0A8J4BBB1_9CHLO|nr:hypothetical protein Vafri_10880 [Volvox africanus]
MPAIISSRPVKSTSAAFIISSHSVPQLFPFPLPPPATLHDTAAITCRRAQAPITKSACWRPQPRPVAAAAAAAVGAAPYPYRRPQPRPAVAAAVLLAMAPTPQAILTPFRHCPTSARGPYQEWEYPPYVSPFSTYYVPQSCHNQQLGATSPPPRHRHRIAATTGVTARTPPAATSAASPLDPPTIITSFPAHLHHNVLSNGLLLIDKPPHWEVAEVVTAVQRATRADKVASVAPLDAAASGLMLLCFGAATRLSSRVEKAAKRYEGAMVLGSAAASADVRGASYISEALPWSAITDEELQEAADGMLVALDAGSSSSSSTGSSSASDGTIIQVLPPRYRLRQYPSSFEYYEEDKGSSLSTISLNLHDFKVWRASEEDIRRTTPSAASGLNQAGQKPTTRTAAAIASGSGANDSTDPRVSGADDAVSVSKDDLQVQRVEDDRLSGDLRGRVVRFSMMLSGRAHVRSVVAMYGRRLRTCACLDDLRRTEVGSFSVADAWPLEALLPIMERYKR